MHIIVRICHLYFEFSVACMLIKFAQVARTT